MLTVKLKNDNFLKETKKLANKVAIFNKIHNEAALFGWFEGKLHDSTLDSGGDLTLAELALMNHSSRGNTPARPVLAIALHKMATEMNSPQVKASMKDYFVKALSQNVDDSQQTLMSLAMLGRQIAHTIMGSSELEGVKGSTLARRKVSKSNTPLVDTGELRDGLDAKTSKQFDPKQAGKVV